MRLVVLPRGADRAPVRAYARRVGLPPRWLPPLPRNRDRLAEPPLRRDDGVRGRAARRPALPPRRRAATRAPSTRSPPPRRRGARRRSAGRRSTGTRSRSAPTASARCGAYSRRHYGEAKAKLVDPKVIVEHYTASTTYSSAFNTFAANAPDVEFGERPGVCAHFADRPRRRDPPARLAALALPPHRRPQPHGDRDRARRHLGRGRDGPAGAARGIAGGSPAGCRRGSGSARAT